MSWPLDPRLIRRVPAIRRLILNLFLLQLIGAACTLVQAGALARVIVVVIDRHGPLGPALVVLALGSAGRAVVAALVESAGSRASHLARAQLRFQVLAAVVRLGPGWAGRQPNGRLVTVTGPGLESVDGYLTRAVPALVSASIVPAIVFLGIGILDWRSAVVLVLALPLVPLFMVLVGRSSARQLAQQYTGLARLAGHFVDLVQGVTTLKIYGQADRQLEGVRQATDGYRRRVLGTLRIAFLSGLVLDLIATLSVAVVAVDIGLRLDAGHLSLVTALVVLLLAPELFAPLRAVGAQYHAAEEGRAAAADAMDIVQQAPDLPDGPAAATPIGTGWLALREVELHYPGREVRALGPISFELRPGEIVALTGPSGAGKTSLLSVVLGFQQPSAGHVDVGTGAGVSRLGELPVQDWRRGLSWVPQRPGLTQPTVGEEVRLGAPQATAEQVCAAIAACSAPSPGIELGEDGASISAGQRRRVALARALLRAWSIRDRGGVPLVLLDEPSEDLDAATEEIVAAVICSMSGWATVLMISHSAALRAVADRRITLSDGRLTSDRWQRRSRFAIRPVEVEPIAPGVAVAAPVAGRGVRELFGPRRVLARRLAPAVALSAATGLAGLALLAISLWLICRASEHPNVQALEVAVVGVRTFALAKALLRYGERLTTHNVALRLLTDVRVRVFGALAPLAPVGLAGFRRGDLLRRFVSDVDGIQDGLVRTLIPVLGAVVTCAAAIGLTAALVPTAGLVLAAGVVTALLLIWCTRRLAGSGTAQAEWAGRRDQATAAMLTGLPELLVFGAEGRALDQISEVDRLVRQSARRPRLVAAVGLGAGGLVSASVLPGVLAVGAAAVSAGRLSPIAIGVIAAAVLSCFDALAPLPVAFAAWSRVRAGLDRVVEVLGAEPAIDDPPAPLAIPAGDLGLRLADVDLAAMPKLDPLLRGLDLDVAAHRRVALIGPSGSGKSTILTAALRLLAPKDGQVQLFDERTDVALAELGAADVVPAIAGSLQGDHVFNTSLRDNLRLVRPTATDHDLDVVAHRCGLLGFVRSLPDGWGTAAGADGLNLSGGERQRLLLARALLADPRILVLDEPTAHLDAETERAILADLLAGTEGRTVLFSTHRALRPELVDAVATISDGRLLVSIGQ